MARKVRRMGMMRLFAKNGSDGYPRVLQVPATKSCLNWCFAGIHTIAGQTKQSREGQRAEKETQRFWLHAPCLVLQVQCSSSIIFHSSILGTVS